MDKNLRKTVAVSAIGNALEFYDFTICGVFIATISTIYFPSSNPTLSLFASFFAFSAAFWTRPFGAYVFGYIGDRFGRKKALTISVSLMGLPTFFIGVLPGYETIGTAAPIILILCRMLQGLCTGGEYNGAAIFALEHGTKKQSGFISGFISSSCVMGAITATLAGVVVFQPGMPAWAWRVPFLFGALVSLVGYYLRRSSQETPEYLQIKNTSKRQPILSLFKESKAPFLTGITMGGINGALSYTLFAFLNVYLSRYVDIPIKQGISLNMFGLGSFMLLCVVFGALSDYITPKRSILLSFGMIISFSWLSFYLLQIPQLYALILGQLLLGALVASFVGPCHAFLQKLFAANVRYTGVAMSFCIGMAITGGTTPMLLTYLIDTTGNLYMPAILLSAYAIISTIVVAASKSEQSQTVKKTEKVTVQTSKAA